MNNSPVISALLPRLSEIIKGFAMIHSGMFFLQVSGFEQLPSCFKE